MRTKNLFLLSFLVTNLSGINLAYCDINPLLALTPAAAIADEYLMDNKLSKDISNVLNNVDPGQVAVSPGFAVTNAILKTAEQQKKARDTTTQTTSTETFAPQQNLAGTIQSAQQQNLNSTTTGAPMAGPTLAIPADSMLAVNDEYTYIVQKINAEMDVMISECSMLGLKKPELLTGKQDSNTGQPSSGGDDNSSSGDTTPGDSTNNDDEIVFQL